MKKLFLLLGALAVAFLLSGSTAFSQNYRVVVKVLSEDRQEPVVGAKVKLDYSSDGKFDLVLTRFETTDWEGMAYRKFGSGYYRITISHPDFETQTETTSLLFCGNSTQCDVPVNISLTRNEGFKVLAINVVAKGDRAHVYEAQIRVDGGVLVGSLINSSTDGSGNAIINMTKNGHYNITISHVGFESITDQIYINDDEDTYIRSYEMKRTKEDLQRKVTVVVKGENERGIMGRVSSAEVQFMGDLQLVKLTDANGSCGANHNRAPGEAINVRVSKEGYKTGMGTVVVSTKMDGGYDYIEVILEREEVNKISLLIVEVLDYETDKAVAGASVRLEIPGGTSKTGTTIASGEVRFPDMKFSYQGATAKVVVSKPGYEEKWSDITSDLMTGKDNSERQFVVYIKKKPTDAGNWNGYYLDGVSTMAVSASASSFFASWTYTAGDSKGQGTLKSTKIEGNKVTGTWNVGHDDLTKSGTRSGTFTITLDGKSISGQLKEDAPNWAYKPGYNASNVQSSMYKGAVWPLNLKKK